MIINLEALASSPYFAKPYKHTFFEAVKEAIRFIKQRLKNAAKRVSEQKGHRSRRHKEANFGENETEL